MRILAISTTVVVLLASLFSAAAQAPTPTTPEAPIVPPESRLIRVWWPDTLYALEEERVSDLLENQIEEFNRLNPGYDGELRIKKHDGLGSSLSTMLAAQEVAPDAIPDLVLLSRADLLTAVNSDLIRPIDDWVPDAIRDDLLPGVLQLGEVGEMLYGLPYAVTVQHAVYDLSAFDEAPTSFAAVLEGEQPFLLPTMPPNEQEVNDIVLAQYLAAGGRLADDAGVPTLYEDPLREVLTFYEEGLQNDVFTPELMDYSSPLEYWSRLAQGNIPLAIVDSTLYVQRRDVLDRTGVTSIPTADGESMVVVDGWLWALISEDAEQRRGALAFLESLISAEPMADYTEAFGILPARQRALRIWSLTSYTTQVTAWMDNIIIIPIDQRNNIAAQLLNTALMAVMEGTSADEATDDALNGLLPGG
jgi:ABC-type glycerol-3-phosphate transport system substrate-binding protein